MDLSKYKSLFISESREHLEEMTNNLIALERNPACKEAMDDSFRHAHSVKGMAASMGYDPIQVLSHTMEDVMDVFRKGSAKITPEAVDELLAARDVLSRMVDEVESSEEPRFEIGPDAIERLKTWSKAHLPLDKEPGTFMTSMKSPFSPPPPVDKKAEDRDDDFGGFDGEVVSGTDAENAPAAASIAGWPDDRLKQKEKPITAKWFIHLGFEGEAPAARAFLAIKRIESLGEVESNPSLREIRSGQFSGTLKIDLKGEPDISKVREVLDGLTGVQSYQIEPIGGGPAAKTAAAAASQFAESAEHAAAELPRTIRVETRSLDNFVSVVGELLTVKNRLRGIAQGLENQQLDSSLDKFEGLIHELHSQVMDVRMMPLDVITSRLPRSVRDLGRTAAKEVELAITGEDIELDRAILERLGDPFVHLLRNSVDHGIEYPDERERMKKSRSGKITLSASREKDMIVIEVTDDGKGIDIEVVKETAIARGLISAEAAEKLSQNEALMLICIPGFSTSETVSFISGRGVGMDVVKSTIESLGGSMRITTKLGEGTRTTLHLPRTVSILNVLLVKIGTEIFAVPIGKLVKTIEITHNDIKDSQMGRMVIMDNNTYPIYDLRDLLKINGTRKENHKKTPNGIITALIVDHGLKPFAVVVDGFLGQEEAFIRPLGRPLSRIDGLSGIMTRGDGRPVFVLDIPNLRGGA